MRRLLLLFAALCALAPTVAAQADTLAVYYPLAAGNQWTYVIGSPSGNPAPTGYIRWIVESASGGTATLHGDRLDATGTYVSSTTCGATVSFQTGSSQSYAHYTFSGLECYGLPGVAPSFNPGMALTPGQSTGPFDIGSQTVVVRQSFGFDEYTMGGAGYAISWRFGRGIGPLYFTSYNVSSGHTYSGTNYRLVHAVVGGTTYGSVVSATEPLPAGAALTVQVAPNPVREAAVLDVALPASADVRAEVYDVTGRRVLTHEAGTLAPGRHRLGLDATTLAPGTYVVRVTAGEATATARLVRAE